MDDTDLEQIKATYEEDGVVLVRSFLPSDKLAEVSERLKAYISNTLETVPPEHVVYEGSTKEIRNLWRLDLYDTYFEKFGRAKELESLVPKLTGWKYALHFVEAFMKPARVGSEVPMHQDVILQGLSSPQYLAAWFPLDPVDSENSPLHFIRGSHNWGPMEHETILKPGSRLVAQNAEELKKLPTIVGVMNPGDVALFNGYTLHYSPPNPTNRPRRAIAVGMRSASVLSEPEVRSWGRALNSARIDEMPSFRGGDKE
jgi:phytanoyl-CoA hydroxylase